MKETDIIHHKCDRENMDCFIPVFHFLAQKRSFSKSAGHSANNSSVSVFLHLMSVLGMLLLYTCKACFGLYSISFHATGKDRGGR